jgi:uncharacterized protein
MACSYCFNNQGRYDFDNREVMSEETAYNAIDFLMSNCSSQCDVSFFGGEPLTQFGLIKKVVEYAEARSRSDYVNISFHITTNGILVAPEIADFLKQHCFSIIVSLDGDQDTHDYHRHFANGRGTYQEVMNGVKMLLAVYGSQDRILIRGTYTHQQTDFAKSFRHLVRNGFENISIEPATGNRLEEYVIKMEDLSTITEEYGRLAQDYEAVHPRVGFFHFTHILENLHRGRMIDRPCGAADGYMLVAPNGDLYPCHRIVAARYLIGNVNEIAQGSDLHEEVRNRFRSATTNNRPSCQACWARNVCGGSCYAYSIANSQDISETVQVECELVKLRTELAIGMLANEKLAEGQCFTPTFPQYHQSSTSCGLSCERSCQSNCERDLQCGSCGSGCMSGCQSGCTSSCAVKGNQ